MTPLPRKSLSQHYLQDKNIARKIVEALQAKEAEQIIEVGPGPGILSHLLAERYGERLTVVEIDSNSAAQLREKLPAMREKIIEADFLKFPLPATNHPETAIIGNFPYHITSPIFFRVLEHREAITEVVAMIQKEVAERLVCRPGNKTYGLLSVLLQTFYDVRYLFTVSEKVFYPQPRVKSAVIRLERNDRKELPCPADSYFTLVKKAFNQRRKTLRNALKELLPGTFDHELLSRRAEQLSTEDFIRLCHLLSP